MTLKIYRDPNKLLSYLSLVPRPYTDLSNLRLTVDRGLLDREIAYLVRDPSEWALYGPIATVQPMRRAVQRVVVVDVRRAGEGTAPLALPEEWRAESEVQFVRATQEQPAIAPNTDGVVAYA